jgi:hypothetical protein
MCVCPYCGIKWNISINADAMTRAAYMRKAGKKKKKKKNISFKFNQMRVKEYMNMKSL